MKTYFYNIQYEGKKFFGYEKAFAIMGSKKPLEGEEGLSVAIKFLRKKEHIQNPIIKRLELIDTLDPGEGIEKILRQVFTVQITKEKKGE